jgi:hypothetical protein
VIELYAVTDGAAPPPSEPLRTVSADGLALLCAPAGDTEVSPERLWERERVIEELMESSDLLPMRYGTRVADEAAAARVLHEHGAELSKALERVRGAVELSVRALPRGGAEAPSAEAQSGTEYLRARVRAKAARESAAKSVHAPLAELARASSERPDGGSGDVLRAAYLVDRAAVDRFVERVSELQAAHPELRLLCTGPWPAYSFSQT